MANKSYKRQELCKGGRTMKGRINEILQLFILLSVMAKGFFFTYAIAWLTIGLPTTAAEAKMDGGDLSG